MTPLNILLLVLVLAVVAALAAATMAGMGLIQRRQLLQRVGSDSVSAQGSLVLRGDEGEKGTFKGWIERMGSEQKVDKTLQAKLIQAGYDTPGAPALYLLLRMTSFVAFPVLALLFLPRIRFEVYVLLIVTAVFVGIMLPMAFLDRMVRLRQERIRRSVPDALDLMVVCVEAGVSLDAAILRVAREVRLAHEELAHELAVVNRLTNAGMPRDHALRGLWQRTGVEDIRTLVSALIQSEKWGTSIATVLRVSAETLRRKRRQLAEKKAKMAPLKMTFPLLFFILPALFIVILGPAMVIIFREFGKV